MVATPYKSDATHRDPLSHQTAIKPENRQIFFYNAAIPEQSEIELLACFDKLDRSFDKFINHMDLSSSEKNLIESEADRILKHDFTIFGINCHFGEHIDFHKDPKTNRIWPKKYWGDIQYRTATKVGGIKFAWELNRLQMLPQLAIAFYSSNKRKYLDEIFSILRQWVEQNPYPIGINWISGIELGIRIVNVVFSLILVGSRNLTIDEKKLIARFVLLHGNHLSRYPSRYSSCANHAIAEALGLFMAGTVFGSSDKTLKWKKESKKFLESEVLRQIYPDGSSFEHTVPYLQFVADHYLIFYTMCMAYNEKVSENVLIRLKAICNFIAHLIDINGNMPSIGDEDGGYLLSLWFNQHNNFISILNSGGLLFNRQNWIHPSASLDVKTKFILGESSLGKWSILKKKEVWSKESHYFKNAGLSVILHHKSGNEILFVGNSGPLGLQPMGGHGHADALSFWLSYSGNIFFADPGTYLYHSGGKWRRYFRSTSAHNTLVVDGLDQAEQTADFMFGEFYQIEKIKWIENDNRIIWGGQHTGYERLPDPVIHRREVEYVKRQHIFKISDTIFCDGPHDVQMFYHLHPLVTPTSTGKNSFRLSSG